MTRVCFYLCDTGHNRTWGRKGGRSLQLEWESSCSHYFKINCSGFIGKSNSYHSYYHNNNNNNNNSNNNGGGNFVNINNSNDNSNNDNNNDNNNNDNNNNKRSKNIIIERIIMQRPTLATSMINVVIRIIVMLSLL